MLSSRLTDYKKFCPGKGLEAVQIERVGLEELDPGASDGRGQLLRDGVHGVPQARHSQAVVRVHPARRSVILVEDQASGFVDDEEAVDGGHRRRAAIVGSRR